MKKIAIVGSRNYPNKAQVVAYVRSLPRDTILISGGAPGVDTIAMQAAIAYGIFQVIIYPAQWALYDKPAGMIRNRLIVEACDEVVAFHYNHSVGTANTIDLARKAGKSVTVFEA